MMLSFTSIQVSREFPVASYILHHR